MKKKKTKSTDDEESDLEAEDKDSDSSSDSDEDEEESDPEDDYMSFVPKRIQRQPRSMKKIRRWIQDIEDEAVTVERLLKSKIRKKYKHEIFEWIMIYENTMPLSEERREVRQQISQMMEAYEKEYHQYKANKKEVKAFEKKNKDYNEMYDIQYKILRLHTSDKNKEAIYRKFMELKDKSGDIDEEFYKLKNWIQSALQLPFDRVKQFPTFIRVTEYLQNVKQIFDAELYGMNKVKEQLLLFIHGKLLNPDMKGCCLGLVGEPGVGKTSIARCLARVMDFPFEQITFGGVNSADYIRGFDYTYVGSRPGEIARCLTRMEYKNGIIFFDEYEKISQNKDITACLLHVTDFTQNNTFRDNYLSDLQLDLSSLWFIYSMNSLPEDEALKDRMFCITVEGYKEVEKIRILCDYLLGKHLKNLGLEKTDVVITDDIARELILRVCPNDKGIRTMEKHLKDLLSKISFLVSNQDAISCSFSLPSRYLPMTWPITVTTDMLSILLKDVNSTPKHLSMYS
jgi:ATP-dependent Lon protease